MKKKKNSSTYVRCFQCAFLRLRTCHELSHKFLKLQLFSAVDWPNLFHGSVYIWFCFIWSSLCFPVCVLTDKKTWKRHIEKKACSSENSFGRVHRVADTGSRLAIGCLSCSLYPDGAITQWESTPWRVHVGARRNPTHMDPANFHRFLEIISSDPNGVFPLRKLAWPVVYPGGWGPEPPYPQDFFTIMQFSGNFKEKTAIWAHFGLSPLLGSKLCRAPLTKILDPRLLTHDWLVISLCPFPLEDFLSINWLFNIAAGIIERKSWTMPNMPTYDICVFIAQRRNHWRSHVTLLHSTEYALFWQKNRSALFQWFYFETVNMVFSRIEAWAPLTKILDTHHHHNSRHKWRSLLYPKISEGIPSGNVINLLPMSSVSTKHRGHSPVTSQHSSWRVRFSIPHPYARLSTLRLR